MKKAFEMEKKRRPSPIGAKREEENNDHRMKKSGKSEPKSGGSKKKPPCPVKTNWKSPKDKRTSTDSKSEAISADLSGVSPSDTPLTPWKPSKPSKKGKGVVERTSPTSAPRTSAPRTPPRTPPKAGSPTLESSMDDAQEEDFEVAVLARDEDVYGFGKCTIGFLQCFRVYPSAFLVVLCFLVMTASFLQHGVIAASYDMWQRRFGFDAYHLACTRAMFEFGALITSVLIVLFGDRGFHRPRLIAGGGILVGFGAIIVTMPHFISDEYHLSSTADLCILSNNDTETSGNETAATSCDHSEHEHAPRWSLFVIMFGELAIGIGSAAYYILGITFLDENASIRTSGVYTGVILICHLAALIPGNLLTTQANRIWGDIEKGSIPPTFNDKTDTHHWYGAWWIPTLFGGFLSWLGAAIMMPFPRQLSGAFVAKIHNERDAAIDYTRQEDYDVELNEFRRVWLQLKHLRVNSVYVGSVLEYCFRNCTAAGMSAFLSSYIQAMFDLDSTWAGMAVGILIASSALIGLCAGPLLQYLFHLGLRGNLRLCTIAALAALLFSTVFAVHCPKESSSTKETPIPKNLDGVCDQCKCPQDQFDPHCFKPIDYPKHPKVNYYSLCFAGCRPEWFPNENSSACECLPSGQEGKLSKYPCSECSIKRVYAFLIGAGWVAMCVYVRSNPNEQVLLRSVNFKLRSIALAVVSICQRITSIPAPFLYGAMLYNACKIQAKNCMKEEVRCAVFDQTRLFVPMVANLLLFNLLCLVSTGYALYSYTRKTKRRGIETTATCKTNYDCSSSIRGSSKGSSIVDSSDSKKMTTTK